MEKSTRRTYHEKLTTKLYSLITMYQYHEIRKCTERNYRNLMISMFHYRSLITYYCVQCLSFTHLTLELKIKCLFIKKSTNLELEKQPITLIKENFHSPKETVSRKDTSPCPTT